MERREEKMVDVAAIAINILLQITDCACVTTLLARMRSAEGL